MNGAKKQRLSTIIVWVAFILYVLIIGFLFIQKSLEQPLLEPNVIYIDSCQILSEPNTIYVLTSSVSSGRGCFNITADHITLDCQTWSNRIIYGTYNMFGNFGISSNNSYVYIKNCNITGYSTGWWNNRAIELKNSTNNKIENIKIDLSNYGIKFMGVSDSIITDTTFTNIAYENGISIESGARNELINIRGFNSRTGIYLTESQDNRLEDIFLENLNYGIYLYNGSSNLLYNISIHNITSTGIILTLEVGSTIDSVYAFNNTGAISLQGGENNSIKNAIINNSQLDAISLSKTINSYLYNIQTRNNRYGIGFLYSSNGTTIKNFESFNDSTGLGTAIVGNFGFFNSFDNISILSCRNNGLGLFYPGMNNTFTNIFIANCTYNGIVVSGQHDNYFSDVISINNENGINIQSSENITIKNFTITNNSLSGIADNGINNKFISGTIESSSNNLLEIRNCNSTKSLFQNIKMLNHNPSFFDLYIDCSYQSNVNNLNGTVFVDSAISRYFLKPPMDAPSLLLTFRKTNLGEIYFLTGINGSGTNLSSDIQFNYNFAYFNYSHSGLNNSALITFYNLPQGLDTPRIVKNGVSCSDCYNFTSLNNGIVVFNVSSGGNYSIYDGLNPVTLMVVINSPTNKTYTEKDLLVDISPLGNYENVWFFNGTGNESYAAPVYRTFTQGPNTLIAYVNNSQGLLRQREVTFYVTSYVSCGDGSCNNGETCSSCSQDCGTCPSGNGGNGGGGGGGGGSPPESQANLDVAIDELSFSQGKSVSLEKTKRINFVLAGTVHSISLLSINTVTQTAQIVISSQPKYATLRVGEQQQFDLTGDTIADVLIRLNSMNSTSINLFIKKIINTGHSNQYNESDGSQSLAEEFTTQQNLTLIFIISIISVILLATIVLLVILLKSSRPKTKIFKTAQSFKL